MIQILRTTWKVNRAHLVVQLLYVAAISATAIAVGYDIPLFMYFEPQVIAYCIVWAAALVFTFAYALARERPAEPFRFTAGWFARARLLDRAVAALPIIAITPVTIAVFVGVKDAIPFIHPFSLDPALIELDRSLAGGVDPWRLLQPILGHPFATMALTSVYDVWFVVQAGSMAIAAVWIERPKLRNQFILTWIVGWIVLGNGLALLLSSVGPCLFSAFYPTLADPFTELCGYLADATRSYWISPTAVQKTLVEAYLNPITPVSGISAMPSMHVAVAAMVCLLTWKVSRIAGVIGTAFLAVILVGSVHLGWHYAVDGYAAIAGVGVVWWVCGIIADRFSPEVPTLGLPWRPAWLPGGRAAAGRPRGSIGSP